MKKKTLFVAASIIFSCMTAFPDQQPVDQITSDPTSDLTTDEYVFAGLLNDDNRQAFQSMSPEKRQECMNMVQLYDSSGNHLSPDAAVDKVTSLDQKD